VWASVKAVPAEKDTDAPSDDSDRPSFRTESAAFKVDLIVQVGNCLYASCVGGVDIKLRDCWISKGERRGVVIDIRENRKNWKCKHKN